MLKTGITHVTLPAKPGVRNAAQRIELGEKFSDELPNAPADTAGHTSVDQTRETFKYKYAERSTRDGRIPTMEELKEVCIAELQSTPQGREKLECNLQKFLRSIGAEWLWTPAYCPWLQPIETFWAGGKNQCAPLLLLLALACAVRETLLLLLLLCCVAVLPGRTTTVAR
jgi:hypothetical protein